MQRNSLDVSMIQNDFSPFQKHFIGTNANHPNYDLPTSSTFSSYWKCFTRDLSVRSCSILWYQDKNTASQFQGFLAMVNQQDIEWVGLCVSLAQHLFFEKQPDLVSLIQCHFRSVTHYLIPIRKKNHCSGPLSCHLISTYTLGSQNIFSCMKYVVESQ